MRFNFIQPFLNSGTTIFWRLIANPEICNDILVALFSGMNSYHWQMGDKTAMMGLRFGVVVVTYSEKPHGQDEPISVAICVWITLVFQLVSTIRRKYWVSNLWDWIWKNCKESKIILGLFPSRKLQDIFWPLISHPCCIICKTSWSHFINERPMVSYSKSIGNEFKIESGKNFSVKMTKFSGLVSNNFG